MREVDNDLLNLKEMLIFIKTNYSKLSDDNIWKGKKFSFKQDGSSTGIEINNLESLEKNLKYLFTDLIFRECNNLKEMLDIIMAPKK